MKIYFLFMTFLTNIWQQICWFVWLKVRTTKIKIWKRRRERYNTAYDRYQMWWGRAHLSRFV